MYRLLIAALVIILSNVVTISHTEGQNEPLVVFIAENDWLTASAIDPGPDGISRLAEIFTRLGARTESVSLSEPLPEEAEVVVLSRPLQAIPADALARLWRHIEQGNGFLLTIDPIGYPEERTESADGGLGRLLTTDYGVSFRDTFLAEPWFTNDTVAAIEGSIVRTYADSLEPHPVIEPLARFGVPIYLRGARTVRTEPFGIRSFAYPLLLSESAYGETTREVFVFRDAPARLELNIGADEMGTLVLAGLGENVETGSRIAVLGDTAVVQNGFGLEQITSETGDEVPRFPGDQILAERLAAWLLDLPEEEWLPLPSGFSWVAVDGDASDWSDSLQGVSDSDDQDVPPGSDIQQARAFQNYDYLYVLVQPREPLSASMNLQLLVEREGGETVTVSVNPDEVVMVGDGDESPILDAQVMSGDVLEVRIPLRVVGVDRVLRIEELCLGDSAGEPADCLDETLPVRDLPERDPASLRFPDGPLISVTNEGNEGTNLRQGPGTNFPTVTTLPNGTLLLGYGRNEAGDWVYVENSRYGGWMSASLITSNGDVSLLPVLDP
jgi:hypothetical protein